MSRKAKVFPFSIIYRYRLFPSPPSVVRLVQLLKGWKLLAMSDDGVGAAVASSKQEQSSDGDEVTSMAPSRTSRGLGITASPSFQELTEAIQASMTREDSNASLDGEANSAQNGHGGANGKYKQRSSPLSSSGSKGNLRKGFHSSHSFNELANAIGQELDSQDANSGNYSGNFSPTMGVRSGQQHRMQYQQQQQQHSHQQYAGIQYQQQHAHQRGSRGGGLGNNGGGGMVQNMGGGGGVFVQQQSVYPHPRPHMYSPQRGTLSPSNSSGQLNQLDVSASRVELSPFINEDESRALILFHPPHISPVTIRDTCQKCGVMYYIRPEFHQKGITLLSYFDLRSAIHAHKLLPEELGIEAMYSVMLHAATSNSEEYKLLLQNLPNDIDDSNIHSIFSRYGQLRSVHRSPISSSSSSSSNSNSSSSAGGGGGKGHVEGDSSETKSLHEPPTIDDSSSNDNINSNSSSSIATTEKGSHAAYSVEYYNIQDSRLAASELSATSAQLWGPQSNVSFAPLDDRKQQLCHQLLATLSRWRGEMASRTYTPQPAPLAFPVGVTVMGSHAQQTMSYSVPYGVGVGGMQQQPQTALFANQIQMPMHAMQLPYGVTYYRQSPQQGTVTDVGMMIDGNWNVGGYPSPPQQSQGQVQLQGQMLQPQQQQMSMSAASSAGLPLASPLPQFADMSMGVGGKDTLVTPPLNASTSLSSVLPSQAKGGVGGYDAARPRYHSGGYQSTMTTTRGIGIGSSIGGGKLRDGMSGNHNTFSSSSTSNSFPSSLTSSSSSSPSSSSSSSSTPSSSSSLSSSSNSSGAANSFTLDIDKINDGTDTRTTVMVRNIPNKYNQQMLLEEVNVRHQGTYDFFYLPIDFKNRCNVGYCFINFLEPKFIIPFVREFNGQRWMSFNSEKICAVTFARIQGRAAMISRFQNSSLLEKDNEYRPLLFYSSGPEKGQPEPFPITITRTVTTTVPSGLLGGIGISSNKDDEEGEHRAFA